MDGVEKVKFKKKNIWLSIVALVISICLSMVAAGFYFFKVACVPEKKGFISANSNVVKKSDPLYKQKSWYFKEKKQKWYMTSASDNYKLDANYIPKANSNKTAVILHGYMNNKDTMAAYAYLLNKLGYNVLLPDARAHGDSEGKYIGYGWIEKSDVKKWINKVLAKNGSNNKVVLFGVSMGGATAMMTSGEKLPKQVKAVVEDCGYTSVKDEIEHEAQDLYHMPTFPRFPMVEIVSGINKAKVGYFFQDGSSVNQLKKNTRPILFIHGAKDTFVPTKMVYQNYKATKSPKELWIVPKAQHAKSYQTAPKQYEQHVARFLNKYVKN
ncbi:alpha/beta hydrolase [Lactobacillus intestinalis]|uniref:Alpha/beta hydrolase n=2 Tax=Lactobacillus intestinalis TaxID=151781 RepID=A0A4S2BM02_9LACO|nr:alpha/beta hydrolase [Lactobacillus intestinalis]